MKKLISVILSISIILSLLPVTIFAENAIDESEEYEENLKFLNAIGALTDIDYGMDRILTRAEFATLIVRFLGFGAILEDNKKDNKSVLEDLTYLRDKGWVYVAPKGDGSEVITVSTTGFSDVSADDEYKNAVEFVVSGGFMVADDARFRPNDNVTGEEILRAMSILLNLGCGENISTSEHCKKAMAERLLTKATQWDMSRPLRMKDISTILINTLDKEPFITNLIGKNIVYKREKDYKLINQLFDVYKDKGIVCANEYAAINGYTTTTHDYIVIGDVYYMVDADVDTDELLGYDLDVYYRDEDNERRLVYYKPRTEAKDVTVVESEDIISFENHTLRYVDKNMVKSIQIGSDMSIIYNGVSIDSYSDDVFKPKNGKIVLMKTGSSGNYDIAKITKYDVVLVKSVDYTNKFVLADIGDVNRFYFDDYDELEVYMEDGTAVGFDTIGKDAVLSIAQTLQRQKKRCRVIISNETIPGTFEKLSKEDNTVIISGAEYTYNSDFVNFEEIPIKTEIILYCDCRGVIVDYKRKEDSDSKYGYLRKVTYSEDNDDECRIKIYEANDTFSKYTVSESIKINGKKYKVSKTRNILLDSKGETNYQVIRYSTDEKGNLAEICTADGMVGAFTKYDITKLGVSELQHRNGALLAYSNAGFTAFLNPGGYVAFAIPSDRENDDGYGVIRQFNNDAKYSFDELYLRSPDSSFIDVCVQLDVQVEKKFDTKGASGYMMISKIKCCTDENDEIYYEIDGYDYLAERAYMCYDEKLFDKCKDVEKGDIVRFNFNETSGRITWIEKFYDVSEGRMVNSESSTFGGAIYGDNLHPDELFSGWAVDTTDSEKILLVHRFLYNGGKPDISASQSAYARDKARMFKYPTKVVCYDSSSKQVYLGSKQDVVCSENICLASTVLVGSYYENAQILFVIK